MAQTIEKPDWHKLPTPDFDSVIGKGLGPRYMNYMWKDVALYALGVGCSKDDLPYIWEGCPDGFKALPGIAAPLAPTPSLLGAFARSARSARFR